jgi:hypothetical protein
MRRSFSSALLALPAHADGDRNRLKAVLVGTEETPAIFTAGSGRLVLRIADGNMHTAKHPGGEIRGQIKGRDHDD